LLAQDDPIVVVAYGTLWFIPVAGTVVGRMSSGTAGAVAQVMIPLPCKGSEPRVEPGHYGQCYKTFLDQLFLYSHENYMVKISALVVYSKV